MNLKNSKFLRRIQMLRRISKDRLRKVKERKILDCQLENVFCESSGDCVYKQSNSPIQLNSNENAMGDNFTKKRVDKQKLKAIIETQKRKFFTKQPVNQAPMALNNENHKVNGLIQLNNTCYQVECCPKLNVSKTKQNECSLDAMPSVR